MSDALQGNLPQVFPEVLAGIYGVDGDVDDERRDAKVGIVTSASNFEVKLYILVYLVKIDVGVWCNCLLACFVSRTFIVVK